MQYNKRKQYEEKQEPATDDLSPDDLDLREDNDLTKEQEQNSQEEMDSRK